MDTDMEYGGYGGHTDTAMAMGPRAMPISGSCFFWCDTGRQAVLYSTLLSFFASHCHFSLFFPLLHHLHNFASCIPPRHTHTSIPPLQSMSTCYLLPLNEVNLQSKCDQVR